MSNPLDDFPIMPECAMSDCHARAYAGKYCHPHTLEILEAEKLKVQADARALWAVRVLDNEARQRGIDEGPYRPHWTGDGWEIVAWSGELCDRILERHATPDAARIAAATALVAADPSLDPDGVRA